MSDWKILCDFDGTIAAEDVTDFLLENFAATAWRDLEQQWEQGLIGSRACMSGQVALLEVTPTVLDETVARVAADPGFRGFVETARRLGMPLTVVSDGLDRVIEAVLRRQKISDVPIRSSRLESLGGGKWRLQFPHAAADCRSSAGTCKCAIAARDPRRTLLIGDGRSDFCLADAADFVFAKDKLLSYCLQHDIAHAAFKDFAGAKRLLERFAASPVVTLRDPEPVIHG